MGINCDACSQNCFTKEKECADSTEQNTKKSPSEVQGTNQAVIEAEGTQFLTAR